MIAHSPTADRIGGTERRREGPDVVVAVTSDGPGRSITSCNVRSAPQRRHGQRQA